MYLRVRKIRKRAIQRLVMRKSKDRLYGNHRTEHARARSVQRRELTQPAIELATAANFFAEFR